MIWDEYFPPTRTEIPLHQILLSSLLALSVSVHLHGQTRIPPPISLQKKKQNIFLNPVYFSYASEFGVLIWSQLPFTIDRYFGCVCVCVGGWWRCGDGKHIAQGSLQHASCFPEGYILCREQYLASESHGEFAKARLLDHPLNRLGLGPESMHF